jgi:membrane associated rhomboid family serine protease
VITLLLQISIGTVVESFMGTGRFILYYAIVCLGSNFFGAATNPTYALGSDPIIFGFCATLFSVMLVFWERIPGNTCTKFCQIMMMVMVLVLVLMLLTSNA